MTDRVLTVAELGDPAEQVVPLVAQHRLRYLLEIAARLEAPGGFDALDDEGADLEAVHDFRVALRRLRTWLRAFRPELGARLSHRAMSRLRMLARLTGRARDLEVQYRWLRAVASGPAAGSATWLAEELARPLRRARQDLAKVLPLELARATRTLAHGLARPPRVTGLNANAADSMALACSRAISGEAATLAECFRERLTLSRIKEAHVARVAVKRLRYVLDGLEAVGQVTPAPLAKLVSLQHALGELHDAQLLHERVARLIADRTARKGRRSRDGIPSGRSLLLLRRLLSRRVAQAFARVRRVCAPRVTRALLGRLEGLVRRLKRV